MFYSSSSSSFAPPPPPRFFLVPVPLRTCLCSLPRPGRLTHSMSGVNVKVFVVPPSRSVLRRPVRNVNFTANSPRFFFFHTCTVRASNEIYNPGTLGCVAHRRLGSSPFNYVLNVLNDFGTLYCSHYTRTPSFVFNLRISGDQEPR